MACVACELASLAVAAAPDLDRQRRIFAGGLESALLQSHPVSQAPGAVMHENAKPRHINISRVKRFTRFVHDARVRSVRDTLLATTPSRSSQSVESGEAA
jgi:hypothetical protein